MFGRVCPQYNNNVDYLTLSVCLCKRVRFCVRVTVLDPVICIRTRVDQDSSSMNSVCVLAQDVKSIFFFLFYILFYSPSVQFSANNTEKKKTKESNQTKTTAIGEHIIGNIGAKRESQVNNSQIRHTTKKKERKNKFLKYKQYDRLKCGDRF